MRKYKYEAINLQKKTFKGVFLAENEQDLRMKLAEQQLYLISAKPDTGKTPSAFFTLTGSVKMSELTTFCRQFATMISVGIPVVEAISNLQSQNFSDFFKKTLAQMHEDVVGGVSLSEAMGKHKRVFPTFMRSMIYVGEASGKMDEVMLSLADYYENDYKIKKKMQGALVYPIILIIMAIGILVLMMVFVIPTFKSALSAMNVTMPALTQTIMDISEWFNANWKELVLGLILVILLFKLIGRTAKGRYVFDTIQMKIPVIKSVKTNIVTSRFARSFSLLILSGLDTVDAMESVEKILGNKYVEKKFHRAIEDVRSGMSLTMALELCHIFPPMLIQMLSVGEKTGAVDRVLRSSYSFFDDAVERSINGLLSVIQPMILGIIGGAVGVLFVAIYSPMLEIMNQLGG